jgi:hypothetical protein
VKVKRNDWPGPIVPEFHPLRFDVDVCPIVSLFTQTTVVPTDTTSGFAPNADVDNPDAPTGMLAVTVGPDEVTAAGVGPIGSESTDAFLVLQAAAAKRATTIARRIRISSPLEKCTRATRRNCVAAIPEQISALAELTALDLAD